MKHFYHPGALCHQYRIDKQENIWKYVGHPASPPLFLGLLAPAPYVGPNILSCLRLLIKVPQIFIGVKSPKINSIRALRVKGF